MKGGIGAPQAQMALFCACAAGAFTLFAGVAFAAGDLSISTELPGGTFTGTLKGQGFTLNANGAGGGTVFSGFSIDDPRGTGVGWDVTMTALVFDNATVAGKDIVHDSLAAPLFTVLGNTGSSALPGTLNAAATIDNAGGVVMAACSASGQGMGTYDFTAAGSLPWTLALTADEYAGTYNSTVTTTVPRWLSRSARSLPIGLYRWSQRHGRPAACRHGDSGAAGRPAERSERPWHRERAGQSPSTQRSLPRS